MSTVNDNNGTLPRENSPQDEGIDLIAWVRKVWEGRKIVFISVGVCALLGILIALFSPKVYTVSTVMVPQMNSRGSSLGSLASLAGINVNNMGGSDISPILYPKIVGSVPYRLELLDTKVNSEKCDTAVTLYQYFTEVHKPSPLSVVRKYTLGLPGVILSAIRGKKTDEADTVSATGAASIDAPISLTRKEAALIENVGHMVVLNTEPKEGYLTLVVSGPEALLTAQLAERAQQLLQEKIIEFKVNKTRAELNFIQQRYDEVKAETEALQAQVARFRDRSQGVLNSSSMLYEERVRNKYLISNSVFQELSTQLEQAKLQVKKDTPTFSVLQPVVVPTRKSKPSRAKILVVWLFLGLVIGAGIVLTKEEFMPELKKMWQGSKTE